MSHFGTAVFNDFSQEHQNGPFQKWKNGPFWERSLLNEQKLNFKKVKLKPYHRANSSQPSEHDSSISSLDSPMFKSSSHFGSEFKDGEVEILNPTNQIVQTDICSS